jgi:predicted nucleic acid-binding protein
MMPGILKVFMDTSVVFSAVLSPGGGARKLFQLGEAGVVRLFVGKTVLKECDEIVRRKSPSSLPTLARLLSVGLVETSPAAAPEMIEIARSVVCYEPDAYVLAEAIAAEVDWFVTHDKIHFLKDPDVSSFNFRVGTPGDLIQSFKDQW